MSACVYSSGREVHVVQVGHRGWCHSPPARPNIQILLSSYCLSHPSQSILTHILMFPLTRLKQSIASSKSNPDPAANAAHSPPPTTVPPPHALILAPVSQEHQLTRMMSRWSLRKYRFRSRRRVGGGSLRRRRLVRRRGARMS